MTPTKQRPIRVIKRKQANERPMPVYSPNNAKAKKVDPKRIHTKADALRILGGTE